MDIFGAHWIGYLEQIKNNWLDKVSSEDVVLVSGDISWAKSIDNARQDLQFLAELPGTIVIVKGNHDYWWNSYTKIKSILPQNVIAIQNNACKIGDKIFCGTRGWQLPERGEKLAESDEKILKREEHRLALSLEHASNLRCNNEEVYVMMHYPPFNSSSMSSCFTRLINDSPARYVVYGHLHGVDCYSKPLVVKDDVKYFLTSTDLINHNPILIQ